MWYFMIGMSCPRMLDRDISPVWYFSCASVECRLYCCRWERDAKFKRKGAHGYLSKTRKGDSEV